MASPDAHPAREARYPWDKAPALEGSHQVGVREAAKILSRVARSVRVEAEAGGSRIQIEDCTKRNMEVRTPASGRA